MEKIWHIPYTEEIGSVLGNEEVCVVGIFGKGTWGHTSKNLVINKLASTSVFMPHYPNYTRPCDGEVKPDPATHRPTVEAYYDKRKKIVYLHLTSMLDAARLSSVCAEMGRNLISHNDSHNFWKSREIDIIIALVYLFSVSHILLLVHPVSTFDISYEKLFHHINNIRSKVLPLVKDVLKECTVGRDWWVHGRPCPPRLLFVMMRCHLKNATKAAESSTATEGSGKKRKPPLKRLQHTLEDQVYKILRNSRVLTNNAINCLFTVPPNQAFIHIMTDQFEQVKRNDDPVRGMLALLKKSCETHRDPTAKSHAYRLLTNQPTQWKDSDEEDDEATNPLLAFITQHTELVLEKKGFKDSVGRNPLPTHFEVPLLKNWLKVANKLHNLFFVDLLDEKLAKQPGSPQKSQESSKAIKIADLRTQLRMHVDPEAHFSETRCSKLVSLASVAYQSNLPSHYTSKVHANQLAQALANYLLHARGPAREKYEECVQAECEAFWNDGRRLCEVRSLTGRHCIHRFHQLPADGKCQPDANPPRMYHSSRSRSIAASSCGRVQGSREDPFTLKEANFGFYAHLDAKAIAPPDCDVFQFPIHEVAAADDAESDDATTRANRELHRLVERFHMSATIEADADPLLTNDEASVDKEVSQTRVAAEEESDGRASTQDSEHDPGVAEAKITSEQSVQQKAPLNNFNFSLSSDSIAEVNNTHFADDEDSGPVQQTFTDGMMHSLQPEGVLPLFSSWSLVRLGPTSAYNPSHGLDFPGFLPGTNYLVPWDITCHTEESPAASWPVPSEARKLSLKETKLVQRESTARAYVGYEYETARGQRFICAAPDKAVKVVGGNIRDTVQPVLDLDMPLYSPSPVSGRSGKMLMGQLMRVIIVTPTEPSVHISVKPQVVPGPTPTPVFHPSQPEVTLRHNSMWVLRFPYVYASEMGPHIQPKDPAQVGAWRALKMISVEIDQ